MTFSIGNALLLPRPAPTASSEAPAAPNDPLAGSFQAMLEAAGDGSAPAQLEPTCAERGLVPAPLAAAKTLDTEPIPSASRATTARGALVPGPSPKGKRSPAPPVALNPDVSALPGPAPDAASRAALGDLAFPAITIGAPVGSQLTAVDSSPPPAAAPGSSVAVPSRADAAAEGGSPPHDVPAGLVVPSASTDLGREGDLEPPAAPAPAAPAPAALAPAALAPAALAPAAPAPPARDALRSAGETVVATADVHRDGGSAAAMRLSGGRVSDLSPGSPPSSKEVPFDVGGATDVPTPPTPSTDSGAATRAIAPTPNPADDSSRPLARPRADGSQPRTIAERHEERATDRPTSPAPVGGGEAASAAPSAAQATLPSVQASSDPGGSQPAPVTANPLTPSVPGVGGMTPVPPSRGAPATLAGANMAVIHLSAHGAVETPELGRVSVSARDGDAGVEVQVVAEKKTTVETLLSHAVAMEADVRTVNASVHKLEISDGAPAGDPASWRGDAAGGQSNPNETSKRPDPPASAEPAPSPDPPPARARVRIVL